MSHVGSVWGGEFDGWKLELTGKQCPGGSCMVRTGFDCLEVMQCDGAGEVTGQCWLEDAGTGLNGYRRTLPQPRSKGRKFAQTLRLLRGTHSAP